MARFIPEGSGYGSSKVDEKVLLDSAKVILEKETRLIALPDRGNAIFVGDTHGELLAERRGRRKPEFLVHMQFTT